MAGEFFTMENMLLHAIEGPDFPRSVAASDLLLLENQLPWGVVECLFELTKEPNQERSCNYLTELCGRVWRDPVETVVCGRPLGIVEEKSRSRHLLDTWRLFSSGPDHICEVYSWFSLPSSATELLQIGVKFRRRRSDENILIVTFVNGVMKISPIFGKPFHLLRNLVSMEECDSTGPHQYKITSYCRIMNDLIKSTKDVELLIEKGILPRVGINNEELAGFFNDICNNTVTTSSYSASFVEISRSVWLYYKRHWVWRWIAWIKHDYLHNPSSIWSVSNAVVLVIILTAIRTIYSVLSYYKST
ncbi:putative UPF0481 protein At3g02645 [Rosa rugosa]|uniref:putative UPF0481 protein At3g02645 n=1 Tax=Rosa rugosa TaxID=74645 RepID=UPI002B41528B|nr:putative UPF0481 protein At3g02645 [Rosa rugosa]